MKLNKTIGFAILFLFTITSCEDYLENENKSNLTDDTQWASETNADIYLNSVYGDLPDKWNFSEHLDYYTDDYNISHYYTASNWRVGTCQTPTTSTTNAWSGAQGPTDGTSWAVLYECVRKCNTFIQKIEEYKDNFSEDYYNKRMDEARFLRAYYYSEAFVHIGGLVILTEPLDRNTMTEEEMQVERSTFEDTFDFLASELGGIVSNGYLDVKYDNGDADAGRATLGAALALKGWLELFAASSLFNSGTPYLDDPNNYVHFASADNNRWAVAAATNKQFIDNYGNGAYYELYDDLPNLWRASNEYNSEIIWDRQYIALTGLGSGYERRGGVTYVLGQYMTWGNYNPTQELVDDFLMANGKRITDPESGYDDQNPYVGREDRFYDFIVYDGAEYYLDWMPQPEIIYTRIDEVNPSLNEIDLSGSTDVGDSGYYQKKKLNPDAAPADDASGQNFIYYRSAEGLLN
jgi:hypothetical protein